MSADRLQSKGITKASWLGRRILYVPMMNEKVFKAFHVVVGLVSLLLTKLLCCFERVIEMKSPKRHTNHLAAEPFPTTSLPCYSSKCYVKFGDFLKVFDLDHFRHLRPSTNYNSTIIMANNGVIL